MWTTLTGGAFGGSDAIRSGALPDQASSTTQMTLNGPGILSFDWRVSSEADADWLLCEISDVQGDLEVAGIAGIHAPWESQQLFIPQGPRTVRWTYRKNATGAAGEDAGFLANVDFLPINATAQSFLEWSVANGHNPGTPTAFPQLRDDTAWLLGIDPGASQPQGLPRLQKFGNDWCYQIRYSNSASELLQVQQSADLQSWTSRGLRYVWNQAASTPSVSEFDVFIPGAPQRFVRTLNRAPQFLSFGDSTGIIILDSGFKQVPIMTYHPWAATSSQPWLQIFPPSGTQGGLLTLQAAPNTGNETRSATISFNHQQFTVIQPVDLGSKVGYLPKSISSSTPNAWTVAPSGAPGGHDAIRSAALTDGGFSMAEMTITGPGVVSFDWRVSSETDGDWLLCEITDPEGDHEAAGISGTVGTWEHQQLFIPQGQRVLRWIYKKNETGSAGDDCGFIANVAYHAITASAQNFTDWAAENNHNPGTPTAHPEIRDDTAWLMGIDPNTSQPDGIPKIQTTGNVHSYRVRFSNSATGLLKVHFSGAQRNWTSRGLRYEWDQATSNSSVSEFNVFLPSVSAAFARTSNEPPEFLVLGDSLETTILLETAKQVEVRTYHPWIASTSLPWLQVTPSSGSGSGMITLDPSPNTGYGPRLATLTINNRDFSIIQPVTKSDPTSQPATFGTYGGGNFYFHNEQITVADGPDQYGRQYHAFPDLTKIGDTYWLTYMTSGGHADRRADTVIKTSTDCRTWTERKRFASSRPTGAIEIGDYEFRQGTITDLGGGSLLCTLHKYNVINASNLIATLGNKTAWSLSTDKGATWSTPVELTPINPSYFSIATMTCAVWKGFFYAAAYSNHYSGSGIYRTPIADLKAGTPTWTTVAGDFNIEPCVMVNPQNPDELWVTGRTIAPRIPIFKSTNGTTWSTSYVYWDAPSVLDNGQKPLLTRTENGNWILPKRKTPSMLAPEVMTGAGPLRYYSLDGTPDDEIWPNEIQRSVPNPLAPLNERAWNGVEKSMYFGMVPLGGDLVAMAYALEPQEQYNAATSSNGHRSSVIFSFFGAGNGMTPMGDFFPATQDLMDDNQIDLSAGPSTYRKWMTSNTTITIKNGDRAVALELIGDYIPTFSDGTKLITPTGSYNPDKKNVATLMPGPSVVIENTLPPGPVEILGAKRVAMLFTPTGIRNSGANVTQWINEGDTSIIAELTASTTPPTVALASTTNGSNSVQGSPVAYLNGPVSASLSAIYALVYYPAGNWLNNYEAVVAQTLQGSAAGSSTQYAGSPWADYQFDRDGALYNVAAPQNPMGWHVWAATRRSTPTGNCEQAPDITTTNLSRIMGQTGHTHRGWTGKVGAILVTRGGTPSNREDILIRRWLRSL